MILNMKLEGFPEEILNEIVHRGIASNKTEAIRLMILHYNEHFGIKQLKQFIEDEMAVQRMEEMDEEIKNGKAKVLSKKDILKKYPHLRDE